MSVHCALSHLSFREHPRLVELHRINGVECGEALYSFHARAIIVSHIASCMICDYLLKTKASFSIMIAHLLQRYSHQSLILYVRVTFNGKICTYFLGLMPLTKGTAAAIHEELNNFLTTVGFTEAVLHAQVVCFCSDGASCMIGQFGGVATLLKDKCPLFKTFHCMANRLELAVKTAVDTVMLRLIFGRLLTSYTKTKMNFRLWANDLSIELLKVQKVF